MSKDKEGLLSVGGLKSSNENNRNWLRNLLISVIFGILIPILFPLGHILLFYQLWGNMVNIVDPKTCTCNCWDTVFKGPYESGVAGYKHVYFNSTINTLKMWIITVFFVIFLYETFKHMALLAFKKRLRVWMGILFLTSLHSHYYGWWAHWNYWNDDFYKQWYHQIFFTFTELFSTSLVLMSLDKRKPLQPIFLILVANIALFHIGIATWDQFFINVFQLQGRLHQVLRDLFLMSTDCIQVGVVVHELRKCAERKGVPLRHILFQRPHLITIIFTTSLMYLYILLCPSGN